MMRQRYKAFLYKTICLCSFSTEKEFVIPTSLFRLSPSVVRSAPRASETRFGSVSAVEGRVE